MITANYDYSRFSTGTDTKAVIARQATDGVRQNNSIGHQDITSFSSTFFSFFGDLVFSLCTTVI
jgi:hypothetical protein